MLRWFRQIAIVMLVALFSYTAAVSAQSNEGDIAARLWSKWNAGLFANRSLWPDPSHCFSGAPEDWSAAKARQSQVLESSKPSDDIRAIDLEALKKILQRDPKDTRPLLLNFWATWCDPCREEFPDLVKLDADYKDKGLKFIAVSLDDLTDIKSEVPKFLNQMKATMPVVLLDVKDPEPAIKVVDATWDGQLPATFLYDKDGKVVFRHFGKIKPDELRIAIDKELKK
jgi:thiol-disulfide isomerase/thioredoxin